MLQIAPKRGFEHLYKINDYSLVFEEPSFRKELILNRKSTRSLLKFDQKVTLKALKGSIMVCILDDKSQELVWVLLKEAIEIQENVYFNTLPLEDRAVLELSGYKSLNSKQKRLRKSIKIPDNSYSFSIDLINLIQVEHYQQGYQHTHENKNIYELLLVFDGELDITTDEKEYNLLKDYVIILDKGQKVSLTSPKTCEFLTIWFTTKNIPTNSLEQVFHLNEQLIQLARVITSFNIKEEQASLDLLYKYVEILILQLSNESLRYYIPASSKLAEPVYEDDLFNNIISFLDENIEEYNKVQDIVDKFDISRSTLQNLFKENLDMTPLEYINHVRLKRSKILLREPNAKVKDVAKRLGYASQAYFSRVFRETFGISPSKYIKKYKLKG